MIEYENLARLNQPFVDEFRQVFDQTLAEGMFILGKQVHTFEQEFGAYCGATHCVGVASGLDALTLALRSFEFERGSEVIVPSNTYIATILAVLNSGLTPILVEPDINSYNIDANRIEDAITRKTAAIIVVHLYGRCSPMDEILTLRNTFNLKLIEDCAHAHGAKYKGKIAGTFGDLGAYSFYPTKNLGALGDAGGLVISDEDLASRIRALRNYGSLVKDQHEMVGYNSRLDEIQAGFLRVKLKHLDRLNQVRRSHANIYRSGLGEQFLRLSVDTDIEEVHYIFPIRHPKRDEIMEHLRLRGVETRIHYPTPPHCQKALGSVFASKSYPVSEEIHRTILSLPVSTIHSESTIREIIEKLNNF